MNQPTTRREVLWILAPVVGSFLFVILYITAATLYPGGSGIEKAAISYNWTENYWCQLLNEKATGNTILPDLSPSPPCAF